MGVMTSKAMEQRSSNRTAGAKAPAASGVGNKREVVYALRLPNAPAGKSTAAFYGEDGSTQRVELKDGLYTFKDQAEFRSMQKSMVKAGFVNATYQVGEPSKPPEKKQYEIRFAHPDNQPDQPKEGSVAFKGKDGVDREFELDEHGAIWVADPEVQERLQEYGWSQIDKREIQKQKKKGRPKKKAESNE